MWGIILRNEKGFVPVESGDLMKVVVFGDSITKGVFVEEEQAFPKLVEAKTGLTVIGRGVPGNTTAQALMRFESDVLALDPDAVIIEFGMNDHFLVAEDQHKVAPKEFRANLRTMVAGAKAAGIRPFLMTIHPVIEGDDTHCYYSRHKQEFYLPFGGANSLIELYNTIIRDCAEETSADLIDVASCFAEALCKGVLLEELLFNLKNSDLNDGVHPTALGHELYAQAVVDVFKAASLY